VVILQKSSHTYIKELNVDEYFGEIAFFSDILRQATARSRGFTEVLSLNKESFTDIANQQQYRSAERTYFDIYDKLSFPPHDYNAIFVVCYLCG
jgi:CRP-like cAMP-binding protein